MLGSERCLFGTGEFFNDEERKLEKLKIWKNIYAERGFSKGRRNFYALQK